MTREGRISALPIVFPGIAVHGCKLHFAHALYRKMQRLRLSREHVTPKSAPKDNFLRVVTSCHVPTSLMDHAWLYLAALSREEECED